MPIWLENGWCYCARSFFLIPMTVFFDPQINCISSKKIEYSGNYLRLKCKCNQLHNSKLLWKSTKCTLQSLIDWIRKAKQAQSCVKMLERMEKLFCSPDTHSILASANLKAYPTVLSMESRCLCESYSLMISTQFIPGSRIGIIIRTQWCVTTD